MANPEINESVLTLQHRLDTLESQTAFQEDIIDQLNVELAEHQAQIADLKYQLQLLAGRIKDLVPNNIAKQEDEPPPPHY